MMTTTVRFTLVVVVVVVSMMMTMMNVSAFTIITPTPTPTTTTKASSTNVHMINKNVADMIDNEYYRQHHKEEYYSEWMQQNKKNVAVVKESPVVVSTVVVDDDSYDYMYKKQLMRDEYLARTNPQQYCMDRCIATGYCDVYEDIFDFTPEEVMAFCKDCVVSEEKDECVVPEAFYTLMDENNNINNNNDDSANTIRP